jgi:acetoin utilization deacetylase AcuC-like enzyme
MSKYEVLPQQLLYEGTIKTENIFAPEPIDTQWILATHEDSYWKNLSELALTPKEIRRTGFPLTEELVQREVTIMQGTLQCTQYALQYGVAMNIAGGPHHAFTNRGEGFCLVKDIAIAAIDLLADNAAGNSLVVE